MQQVKRRKSVNKTKERMKEKKSQTRFVLFEKEGRKLEGNSM